MQIILTSTHTPGCSACDRARLIATGILCGKDRAVGGEFMGTVTGRVYDAREDAGSQMHEARTFRL